MMSIIDYRLSKLMKILKNAPPMLLVGTVYIYINIYIHIYIVTAVAQWMRAWIASCVAQARAPTPPLLRRLTAALHYRFCQRSIKLL